MRNLFLTLVLANLLYLAWQVWVDPPAPAVDGSGEPLLALFDAPAAGPAATAAPGPGTAGRPGSGPVPAGTCVRLGPLTDSSALQQAAAALAARGVDAVPIARDAPVWLGHWVQVTGFDSVAAAEAGRQRLVAAGLPEALLMQDGPQPMISLGVFRERPGADRVAGIASRLGFPVAVRDRYRPGVEQWLLVRPRAGQALGADDLALAGGRILRAEPAACDEAAPVTPGGGDTGADPAALPAAGPAAPL